MADKTIKSLRQYRPVPEEIQAGSLLKASSVYSAFQLNAPTAEDFLNTKTVTVEHVDALELNAARLLNVSMSEDPKAFIRILEARIQEITQTRKNVILILDEESGTYTCLNDIHDDDFTRACKELTWISDTYLQDLLDSNQVMHSFLYDNGNIFGIVALADKLDGSAFSLRDEIVLDQLTQYLSVQVNHYLALKKSLVLPTTQRILLNVSNQLLCAVDTHAIYNNAMQVLIQDMPFVAAQYVYLDEQTGSGHIAYQLTGQNGFETGSNTFKPVDQFASMLSLFQSRVWKHDYLYLRGEMLGDKSFSEIFGLSNIASVLLLPMMDANKQLNGALVLFQDNPNQTLSKEALKVIEQVSGLIMSACERARILEKALEIATTDELTGAVNRRGFYSRFDAEVDRCRRNQTPMCLGIIDVDHFKMINDTYGHMSGDYVLKYLAQNLQKNMRKSDLLCRFGGEEFALMLPETSLKAGTELMDRLRRKIEKLTLNTPGGPIKITFSGGIDLVETAHNLSKDSQQIISESLARADEALYQSKQMGRNRITQVYPGA